MVVEGASTKSDAIAGKKNGEKNSTQALDTGPT
jgi:hypothetical protein